MVDVPTQAEVAAAVAALDLRIATLEQAPPALQPAGGGGWSPWTNAVDFGVSTAAADNRGALQAAIDAAYATGGRRVFLPAGRYLMSGAVDVSGVFLEGAGPLFGGLVLTEPGGGLISIHGQRGGVHCPGGGVRNMYLFAKANVHGGVCVSLGSGGQHMPDRCDLSGLRITTDSVPAGSTQGVWERAINLNATTRLSPPGLRGATMRDIEIFNCVGPAVVLWGANGIRMSSVMAYTGGGVQAMMGLWIGGTSAVQSTDVQVSDVKFDGPANVTNTIASGFEGQFAGGIQTDAISQQSCVFSLD